MLSISEIQRFFKGKINLSEALGRYSLLKIGGPADYFFEPVSKEDATKLFCYLRNHAIPFIIVSSGSNMFVSDAGYRGAAVSLERGLAHLQTIGELVVAEGGVRIAQLVDYCIQHSLQGTEMLAGFPGSIGGDVATRAGIFIDELSEHMVEAEVLRDNKTVRISGGEIQSDSDFVLNASFSFPRGDKEDLTRRRREFLLRRNAERPLNVPNAGALFKNPSGDLAANLIERAGLKGHKCGGAMISEQHPNHVVNTGGARATDVLALIKVVQHAVKKQFHISLELELRPVGFDHQVLAEVA
ncbi:MAG: UDP-N-acetylmuramate dehydrogenase [Ignavibacteriae bacterium]|nr:UDP-N-acetylmuramate dehydrogenase [Ignavibacteriota bacterium]